MTQTNNSIAEALPSDVTGGALAIGTTDASEFVATSESGDNENKPSISIAGDQQVVDGNAALLHEAGLFTTAEKDQLEAEAMAAGLTKGFIIHTVGKSHRKLCKFVEATKKTASGGAVRGWNPKPIGNYIMPLYHSQDSEGLGHGLAVEFEDKVGELKTVLIKDVDRIAREKGTLIKPLIDGGYRVQAYGEGKKDEEEGSNVDSLIHFVTHLGYGTHKHVKQLSKGGVHYQTLKDGSINPYFSLQDCIIGYVEETKGNKTVVVKVQEIPDSGHRTSGTLEEWQEHVAVPAMLHSRLAFTLYASFLAPLLTLLDVPGGGFHLHGQTKDGKSTALKVGGSVWGARNSNGYVSSLNATNNALQAKGEEHNDLPYFIDELGEADGKTIVKTVYSLANGSGKGRMSSAIEQKKIATWRLLIMTAGELDIEEAAKNGGEKEVKEGVLTRLPTIPSDAGARLGVLDFPPDGYSSKDEFCSHMHVMAQTYYGTAGRHFIEALFTMNEETRQQHLRAVKEDGKQFVAKANAQAAVKLARLGEVSRRIGLVIGAAKLAMELGTLPLLGTKELTISEIERAGDAILQAFLQSIGEARDNMDKAISDMYRTLTEGRHNHFITVGKTEGGGGRQTTDTSKVKPRVHYGYWLEGTDRDPTEILIRQPSLASILKNKSPLPVLYHLHQNGVVAGDKKGITEASAPSSYTTTVRVDGNPGKYFVLNGDLLENL